MIEPMDVREQVDLDGSQPDAWRYMVEVQDAGKPADATWTGHDRSR